MKHLRHDHIRLTLTYLIIIMTMSIIFSGILYRTAARELERSPRSESFEGGYVMQNGSNLREYLSQRAEEGRASLLAQLIFSNLFILVVGVLVSYVLAERTLKPIEDNMEAQAQFVSDASHELRTPLTAIRTSNEVALRDKKLNVAQARRLIEENIQDVARLQQLTDSMLGLLKDDDTKGMAEVVDLQDIIRDAMNAVVPQAMEKHITIDDTVGRTTFHASYHAMVQLSTILLDNAIKYSPPESTIAVMSAHTSRTVTLIVQDTGIGMDKETIDQIFTRFYRADEARTHGETKGYGLGLAIAKKIVDAHQGKIDVMSIVGEGTTFRVELPTKR